ncbi:carbon storage regulator [Marinobacterium sp. AK62]|uniref:Carbon storage regulator n=1 Tax=Marinobacterium alkalitolerans TaxID=1542925 RepID=A0ABS3Z8P5_9GAMM|nr:carbon storage regulator [Marinobacterium alkalitolerans]
MPRITSLTLSRREGEVLIIDHDIKVIIRKARNGEAKVTIMAPDDVDVIREELDGVLEIEPDDGSDGFTPDAAPIA